MAESPRSRAPIAPPVSFNKGEWERRFHGWMTEANRGRVNCTGTVTLDPNQNSTTVTDSRAGTASFIGFMPTTASAAVEYGNLAVQSQGAGFFTISHSNNAITDRSYAYCIMG